MIEISMLLQDHEGIHVFPLHEVFTEIPSIRETDSISFRVSCPNSFGEPKVFIQDHGISLNRPSLNGEVVEHTVEFSRYLSNHFGVTSIAVSFSNSQELVRVTPINVYAMKVNKEQAEKILEYLSSKMSDVTRLCFSKTHIGSDSKQGETSDTLTKIDYSRRVLEFLSSNRYRFATQPCKRSAETLKVASYEDNTHITDKDISWLFQHLDQIYPVSTDASKVTINNRHFSIDQIQRSSVKANTDLFENRVIYSFLLNLKGFLLSIPDFRRKYQTLTPYKDYFAFDSILQKVEAPLMERRFREARVLLQQCNELLAFFAKYLPCTCRGTVAPILTPHAKRFMHYERSFRMIDSWYKLGQPAWNGTNYLFGLKSLDKLYEFFCLYKIVDNILGIGYKLTNAGVNEPNRSHGMRGRIAQFSDEKITNYYRFESAGRVLEFFYEPTIWAYSELSKSGELIDVFHSNGVSNPYYTPDFVVRLDNGGNDPAYYIFDAKYSTESQTKERHLPEIIEKYYLKIKATGKDRRIDSSAVKLVYALIPKTFNQEHGYHGGPFNIYDSMPTSPYFGFLKVTPDEERPLDRLLSTLFKASAPIGTGSGESMPSEVVTLT
ncbi:nuclease domain-containing protein [Pseudomonas syringae group sp. J254-4]|uniref:nuclease domain-containing protein n=1 Tax=Pseudomonas syringae group sp. J254-4 TaxID=3079589 RepID=UPI00290BC687|nr:nuclease domain-containing protein [Pseudomonas syringae group sp. J254-4]MDU8455120.1 nuclease domain-containing protein [Pseudomonas syringae group sp. J254-4]